VARATALAQRFGRGVGVRSASGAQWVAADAPEQLARCGVHGCGGFDVGGGVRHGVEHIEVDAVLDALSRA